MSLTLQAIKAKSEARNAVYFIWSIYKGRKEIKRQEEEYHCSSV